MTWEKPWCSCVVPFSHLTLLTPGQVFVFWNIPSSFSEPGVFLYLECSFPQLCVYFTWVFPQWSDIDFKVTCSRTPSPNTPSLSLSHSLQYLTLCKSPTTPWVSYLCYLCCCLVAKVVFDYLVTPWTIALPGSLCPRDFPGHNMQWIAISPEFSLPRDGRQIIAEPPGKPRVIFMPRWLCQLTRAGISSHSQLHPLCPESCWLNK